MLQVPLGMMPAAGRLHLPSLLCAHGSHQRPFSQRPRGSSAVAERVVGLRLGAVAEWQPALSVHGNKSRQRRVWQNRQAIFVPV